MKERRHRHAVSKKTVVFYFGKSPQYNNQWKNR